MTQKNSRMKNSVLSLLSLSFASTHSNAFLHTKLSSSSSISSQHSSLQCYPHRRSKRHVNTGIITRTRYNINGVYISNPPKCRILHSFSVLHMQEQEHEYEEFDDMDSADAFPEGAELAKRLYEEVQIRNFRNKLETIFTKEGKVDPRSGSSSNVEVITTNSNKNMNRMYIPFTNTNSNDNARKRNTGGLFETRSGLYRMGPHKSLFTNRYSMETGSGSGSAMGLSTSHGRTKVQRKLQLLSKIGTASSSESVIIAQAGFVFILVLLYLYMGISGLLWIGSGGIVAVGVDQAFESEVAAGASEMNSLFGASSLMEDSIILSNGMMDDMILL